MLLYIQGVSERIGHLLNQQQKQLLDKPQKTINSLFLRPKQKDKTDRPSSGVVYKIRCRQCDFVYYDQTERSLKTRVSEHKKFDPNSNLASHVHECHNQMDFDNVNVVGYELHYQQGNDHIPEVYKCLARA